MLAYDECKPIGTALDQCKVSWVRITEVVINSIQNLRLVIFKVLGRKKFVLRKIDTHVGLQRINDHWYDP